MPETYPSEEDDVPADHHFSIDDPIHNTADVRLESIARAIEPGVFRKPKITLYRDDYDRAYEKARIAITALDASGYVIAPKEASDEMVEAGWRDGRSGSMWEIYRRMIAATPTFSR